MTAQQRLIVFLKSFGVGLLQPVLSLLLLARGCSLATLPLVMAAYGATAFFLELPSGIYADRRGRKRTFLLSVVFTGGGFLLLLVGSGLWVVLGALALYGAGRAFSSGSLDALIIDDFLEREGAETLHRVTSQMTVLTGAGIAAGALTGGFIPAVRGYALHLLLRLLLLGMVAAATLCWVRERPPTAQAQQMRPAAEKSTGRSLTGVGFTPALLRLLVSITALVAILGPVETYWAPALTAIAPASAQWLLGILSATSFLLLSLGSMAAGHFPVGTLSRRWSLYFALQILLGLGAVVLAFQRSVPGFGAAFLLVYFLLGVDDVQEQTLLNSLADSGNRAATLSAASMVSQIGGFGASALCSVAIVQLGIGGIWLLLGLAGCGVFSILWVITLLSRKNL